MLRAFRSRSLSSRSSRRRLPLPLASESLESRTLLTNFVVTNTNDLGSGSLRTAIEDANLNPGPDQITFERNLTGQTILLSSSLPVITEEVDIRGPARSFEAIIIDGNNSVRPLEIGVEAENVKLRFLTVTGGDTFTATDDQSGGGIANRGVNTLIDTVRVFSNFADGDAGGIGNDINASLLIRNSEITGNNTFGYGGGIGNRGIMILTTSTIDSNEAEDGGGGIANVGLLVVDATSIVNNSTDAFGSGGGVYNDDVEGPGEVAIFRSLISGNLADYGGGVVNYGTATLANTTLVLNTARVTSFASGGGVENYDTLTVVNSTIARNNSFGTNNESVGGIYIDNASEDTTHLINSIVWGNQVIAGDEDVDTGDLTTNVTNLIGHPWTRLGPLQDNGGPTMTMAPLADSFAIDAGTNARATIDGTTTGDPLVTDQRGRSRIVGGTVDIGAVEFSPGPDVPIVVGSDAGEPGRITLQNQDGTVRWSRFAFGPSFTGGVRVATGDFNGDGVLDVIAGEGPGGKSRFRVFDGVTGQLITGRAPFGTNYSGGIFVAAGDFNNDGLADIVSGTGGNYISRVRIRDAAMINQPLRNIRVGTVNDMGEVRVAVGDVDGDGTLDVLATVGPVVKVFDGSVIAFLPPTIHEFTPFGPNFQATMTLASGDLNGDGFSDIIVGRGQGGPPRIKLYAGNTGTSGNPPNRLGEIFADDSGTNSGIRVAARDLDNDGLAEIITGAGPGGNPIVRIYEGSSGHTTFFAFTAEFSEDSDHGIFVAA